MSRSFCSSFCSFFGGFAGFVLVFRWFRFGVSVVLFRWFRSDVSVVSAVPVVSVVSFRWFRFCVSGFSICLPGCICNMCQLLITLKSVQKSRKTESAYEAKLFIVLFERAFKMIKNGVYFMVM